MKRKHTLYTILLLMADWHREILLALGHMLEATMTQYRWHVYNNCNTQLSCFWNAMFLTMTNPYKSFGVENYQSILQIASFIHSDSAGCNNETESKVFQFNRF